MNIKQAKQEITNTLRAYLAKDALGNYRIPPVRQRPVLLMGPPGVGKTQIMEQIAAETGVGLVAYTITHHTRQSAVGLPFIEKRTYGGETVSITEYTMSEILASVYGLMEKTGLKEGILFLDEINCVSETLAPMMLQFLQCKTFGNQRLPEGWLIAAAGNPPEYNRSVREFDVVTLDRVKRIDVSEDFGVWKEYARRKGLHGAVVSYLDIKKENFYRVETAQDGLQFATARGWEDLSELLCVYEELEIPASREVIGQYIQLPRIARDFANYLELYNKYRKIYHIDEILQGTWRPVTVSELRAAPFDEKLSVMGLLLSRLSEAAREARRQDALTEALHGALTDFRTLLETGGVPAEILESLVRRRRETLKRAKDAGQLDKEQQNLVQLEVNALEDYRK
ncbi:MAG: AAA family ATPase, partial [Oscillibacter sp.]|nr:AAA family ATPase [Oscillibacter sp.]